MTGATDLAATLQLEEEVPGQRYRANSLGEPGGTVFGGQLLAQSIVAASKAVADKDVKSIHTVFTRSGDPARPLEIEVDVHQNGRTFAGASVTIAQQERVCTKSLVLLHTPDADVIRHQDAAPTTTPAADLSRRPGPDWWDVRFVDDVDLLNPDLVGPANLAVWTRFPWAPKDPVVNQALLAYATDGFLIGTAMRPHAGVGQAQAHVTIATTVLTHTLTFHEPVNASTWLLLCHESPVAGHGRSYGRADVFSEEGVLVASFTQENLIRQAPSGS